MKELKRNLPAIVVKLTLDVTEEVQLFQICTKFIKWHKVGFINLAVLLVR